MFPENIQNVNKPGKDGCYLSEFKLIKRIYLLVFAWKWYAYVEIHSIKMKSDFSDFILKTQICNDIYTL